MAQPQPQHQMSQQVAQMPGPPAFSPTQHSQPPQQSQPPQHPQHPQRPQQSPSPSPAQQQAPFNNNQASFAMPPNKRQRVSPSPTQPGSPAYFQQAPSFQSPYATSPTTGGPSSAGASPRIANSGPLSTTAAPSSAGASPHFSTAGVPPATARSTTTGASPRFPNVVLPTNAYNTPYGNPPNFDGSNSPQHTVNQQQPQNHQMPPPTSSPANTPQPQYAPANSGFRRQSSFPQPPAAQVNYSAPPQATGAMGPPQKPAEKGKDGESVDNALDVLAGAGIDLREEENFAVDYSYGNFHATNASHSFSQFIPRDEGSFYGAGPANRPGEPVDQRSQEEIAKKAAADAWNLAAYRIGQARESEMSNPRVLIAPLWKRMEKIAHEHQLELLTEKGKMGDFIKPINYPDRPGPESKIQVNTLSTQAGPDGAILETGGRFLPEKSQLIDQLALMSLATHQRIRGLVADAARLSRNRQANTHGHVPAEWADAATPTNLANASVAGDGEARPGWESAVSPRTNPLKRPRADNPADRLPTPVSDDARMPDGSVNLTNALQGVLRTVAKTERDLEEARLVKRHKRNNAGANSNAPGTPGSVAPEDFKLPTKKEQKLQAKARQSEVDIHHAANKTTNQFLGKKKYSWMSGGDASSMATTPSRLNTQGLSGGSSFGSGGLAKQKFTVEGPQRIGVWREDKDSGKGLQLRDWLAVLEKEQKELKALQMSYLVLDKKPR